MKDLDVLKDILEYRISNQQNYNDNMLKVRNPEVRELFAIIRDDEMRDIIKLEQKIERHTKKSIISRILPTRNQF